MWLAVSKLKATVSMTVLLHFEGKVLCIADTTRLNCLDCYSVSIGYSNLFLCSGFKLLPKIKNRWISNRSWSKCQYIYLSDSSWPRSTSSICWKNPQKVDQDVVVNASKIHDWPRGRFGIGCIGRRLTVDTWLNSESRLVLCIRIKFLCDLQDRTEIFFPMKSGNWEIGLELQGPER